MSTNININTASVEALAATLKDRFGNTVPTSQAAIMLRTLAAERDALKADNANLRTVMVAAAEEIHAHWHAHCDSEGYGPANLMHRLEQGIPSEYGYTAGRFAELVAERDALRAELDAERAAWGKAMSQAWRMVDPFNPAGVPGSYARGQDSGITSALTTVHANYLAAIRSTPKDTT